MNENELLRKIKSKNNMSGELLGENTAFIIMEFLSQNEIEKNLLKRIFGNIFIKKNIQKLKSPEEIVSENFETIIDTFRDLSDDGKLDMDKVLDFCYVLSEKEDTRDIILKNINKIYLKLEDGKDLFELVQFEKKTGKKIDEDKEKLLEEKKLGIAEYILEDSKTHLLYNERKDYAVTISIIIDELLKSENCKYSDITPYKRGGYSQVFQIGDKILKIGKPRAIYRIPNHRRLLQPLTRTNLLDKADNPKACVEIQERVEPCGNITEDEIYAIYKELRDDGIIWTDARKANLGRLRSDNIPTLNGEKMDVAPNSVGFINGKNKKDLMAGELVVLDLDFIYNENDPTIQWPAFSCSKKFEKRYQQEKAEEIVKDFLNKEGNSKSIINIQKSLDLHNDKGL